ncbi:GNAT family N-acetyltransferase [Leucobacter insecticola]|uniref:GNAT family N-acetyltransferase n=1 Tax=Leucobacter insecticola TaxID=2714934 RepID=A0A6G8FFQ7_9MICO|nr:GNAT family N-acetyltransferase [Leucobacter insecticola]QIM15260.1 GNAT family N-acetyltransferase [Leucobacter insecticola]
MSNSLMIRRVRPEEYAQVGALLRAAYEASYELDAEYLAEIEDVASRDAVAQVLVVEEDDRILGSVTVPHEGDRLQSDSAPGEMDMRLLGVSEEARGRGIGELLMRHCAKLARDRGAHRLVLHTGHFMEAAQRLYERLGFVRLPEREFTTQVDRGEVRIISYGLDLVPKSKPELDPLCENLDGPREEAQSVEA